MRSVLQGGPTGTPRSTGRSAIHAGVTLTLASLVAAGASAAAQQPLVQSSQVGTASWDVATRQLMNQGRLDEAAALVDARLRDHPRDVQARFLRGMIAIARKDTQLAIRLFRSILIDQPDALRVRLELARAFFLAKDYGNALRQFQFVMAGDPPPAVVANINGYLAAIREQKSFSYNFGLAVAPDTNLNTGSSAREVTLFGLPFDLSEDARQRSGVGLAIEGGGEWAPRIGAGKRLRIGLNGQRREYPGGDFDDMTAAAYAGPRLVAGPWDVSLLGTAYRRWYGGNAYNHSFGARIEAMHHLSPRLGITASASAQSLRHEGDTARDGRLLAVNGGGFYALTTSSAVTMKGGVARQTARADAYSNWSGFVAAGFFKDLPMGFSVYAEPSFSLARYDQKLFGFDRKRSDKTGALMVSVLNRHLVLGRFTPRIAYTFTRQDSSIELYRFTRNRLEVGLTTSF